MKEVDPQSTSRATAFDLWMKAPMPMVTLFKKINVTNLVRYAHKHHVKFNMLMCYCIGKAASQVPEYRYLPVGDKLMQYDKLAINTIVLNSQNSINSCDIPYTDNLQQFNAEYLKLTKQVAETCTNYDVEGCMVIGTSALVQYDIDGAVGMYSGIYNNPYIIWSKYKSHLFRKELMLSFQFHHVQMDGAHASRFLNELQMAINNIA
jgi:Chloramphenicol O-acetyltransferase